MAEEKKLLEILDITQRMNAAHDPEALLELIAEAATRLVEADRASILLLDPESLQLRSSVALGARDALCFDARLGIAGAAAMSGQVINVRNAQEDPRFYPEIDETLGYRTRTVLAVPVTAPDQQVLGVFEVLNKQRGAFTREDESVLRQLAAQAAVAIRNAELIRALSRENQSLRRKVKPRATQRLVGRSPQIQNIVRLIDTISDCNVNVLVTGESGTGKELVARAIHESSRRACGPFVAINSAALPESLLEAELFGIEKGVASGVDARPGRFEEASGGTLLLDEIGDLSLACQAKILRALQENMVQRVGGRSLIEIDCRILAATNKNLIQAIRDGDFREDLYYRLKVVHIHTPALREIPDDIPLLADRFLQTCCQEMGRPPKTLEPEAVRRLKRHSWPGNVRELENEMKRLAASVRKVRIGARDLHLSEQELDTADTPPPGASLRDIVTSRVSELETRLIQEALEANRFNQARTAEALGLSRQGLLKKMKRYGILGKD